MTHSIWSLKDVALAGRARPRLVDVSLEISAGVTAVMGSSGAGKSSLLGLLADFEKPDSGSVNFHTPVSGSSLPLFWSPQDDGLWPHLTVQQHIEYVCPSKPQIDRSVLQWLDLFALESLKDSPPESLSQGERSRLSVARTLASEASVIVMDEPLVHVDPLLSRDCWAAIEEHIQRICTAAVFSTHDPGTVLKYAQNVICLQSGAAEFCGPVETLYTSPPTKALAWLLGPCNWFDRDDEIASRPAGEATTLNPVEASTDAGHRPVCVRPSQLEVRPEADGRFIVESFAQVATVCELRVRHRESDSHLDVFVARMPGEISIGDAVELTILARTS